MKTNKSLLKFLLLIPVVAVGLTACIDEDEESEGTIFHCSYEVSRTGCNDSDYSAYEQGCLTVNSEDLRSDVNVATYCDDLYPSSDVHCAAGCCISFKYRNVTQESGACPGTASLARIQAASFGDDVLTIEASWASGDVDLEVLTPARELVASQNPQAGGCIFSGDDRYVLNGPFEAVRCEGLYLAGGYNVILTNHSAEDAVIDIKVTKNGKVIHHQQLTVGSAEPLSHSVTVQ